MSNLRHDCNIRTETHKKEHTFIRSSWSRESFLSGESGIDSDGSDYSPSSTLNIKNLLESVNGKGSSDAGAVKVCTNGLIEAVNPLCRTELPPTLHCKSSSTSLYKSGHVILQGGAVLLTEDDDAIKSPDTDDDVINKCKDYFNKRLKNVEKSKCKWKIEAWKRKRSDRDEEVHSIDKKMEHLRFQLVSGHQFNFI